MGSDATLNPSSFTLLIYSLADPLHPQLVSQTPIDYVFISDLLIQGNTILVPTTGADYFAGVFSFQFGSLVSLDVSNPAKPVLDDVLYNDRGSPDGGDTNQDGGTIVNDHIAYIASSTSARQFAVRRGTGAGGRLLRPNEPFRPGRGGHSGHGPRDGRRHPGQPGAGGRQHRRLGERQTRRARSRGR